MEWQIESLQTSPKWKEPWNEHFYTTNIQTSLYESRLNINDHIEMIMAF